MPQDFIYLKRKDKQFELQLRDAIAEVQGRRKVLLSAATKIDSWIQKNFEQEGKLHDQSQYHWKPLHIATIMARRRRSGVKGGDEKILQDRGALKRDWTIKADDNNAVVKSGVHYSSIHENGGTSRVRTRSGSKTIRVPQRKIFPTEKQADKILKPVFDLYLSKIKSKLR